MSARSQAPESAAPVAEPEAPPFGGLETEVVGDGDGPVVVLLHGYGTPGDDLVPLARELSRDPRLGTHRFVMPEGRLSRGFDSRMWWPIPSHTIAERAEREIAREHPGEHPASREAVLALVADVQRRFSVSPEKIAVGGFSQGAMLAVDVSLHREGRVGPVMALSGSVVAESDWRPRLAGVRGVRAFVSHGRRDPILPYSGGERLSVFLDDAGAAVRFYPFAGDHSIPPDVRDALTDFIADALPSSP
jgi:phospholipase/carboxylesterase